MPNGFCKSEEGVKAYADIGQGYDMTLSDQHHERVVKQSKASPHSSKSTTEVIKIRRVLADDGKEYIVYDETSRGYDNLGNPIHSYRPNLGIYPIPVPRRELRMGPDYSQKEVIAEILRVDTGFSIPFSKENMEKVHKNANDKKQQGATQYMVQRGMHHSGSTVTNYDAMKNGEFVQLEKFGMTLEQWTEQQRAITELKEIAEGASAEEAEKATQSLAETGEQVSQPSPSAVVEEEEQKTPRRRGRF